MVLEVVSGAQWYKSRRMKAAAPWCSGWMRRAGWPCAGIVSYDDQRPCSESSDDADARVFSHQLAPHTMDELTTRETDSDPGWGFSVLAEGSDLL